MLKSNLRLELTDFMGKLLENKKLAVGRYDGRITGPLTFTGSTGDVYDPSGSSLDLLFGNAFNSYVVNELGFQTDREYIPLNMDVYQAWSYLLQPKGGFLSQEEVIRSCVSENPFLKIWVLCGYYDGATPFYAAEYTFSHLFLNDEFKDQVSFTYYPCGHMIYAEKESFDKFRKDAEAWLQ